MNIGLLGLTFGYRGLCNNKGCEALSISFLEVLNEIAKRKSQKYNVYLFIPISIRKLPDLFRGHEHLRKCYIIDRPYSNLKVDVIWHWIYKGKSFLRRTANKCDVVFDFTSGDSFTDIYGNSRYYDLTKVKKQVLGMRIPLVLGSQTIGPFKDEIIKNDASEVIKKCKEVFVRDQLSYDYVEQICGRKAKKTTDVAFFLPYTKVERKDRERIIVGFNPSGLLWQGGYNRNNQFGLKFDYRNYCINVLKQLSENNMYEIVLIPHAYSSNMQSIDNDLVPALELQKKFPNCSVVTDMLNSMEIKSKINRCDVFIGARMHATIAAFSSGVPTIPFAYSRKFKGVYDEYGYSYIIDASNCSLKEAVDETLSYVMNVDQMRDTIRLTRSIICESKEKLLCMYNELLESLLTQQENNSSN